MITVIRLPVINANETMARLLEWQVKPGSLVHRGTVVGLAETSKSIMDIEAQADGYLVPLVEAGEDISVGKPIGVITSEPGEDYSAALAESEVDDTSVSKRAPWTKKAFLVARRNGVDLEALVARFPGKTITEADVLAAQQKSRSETHDLVDDIQQIGRPERVLLIGGAGGAGAIAMDAIMHTPAQRVVGILDNNPRTHGRTAMGVPIIGSLALIDDLWEEKRFDAAVILFTDDVDERAACFDDLVGRGIRFTNIIDPSVSIRSYVAIGHGNVIMANGFIAAGASIGNNNFLASHNCIEHHSVIGSHCTFGPRNTLSGRVSIGDRVKIGMGVAVEPYISIGEHSVIASGAIITANVPAHTTVKTHGRNILRQGSLSNIE